MLPAMLEAHLQSPAAALEEALRRLDTWAEGSESSTEGKGEMRASIACDS